MKKFLFSFIVATALPALAVINPPLPGTGNRSDSETLALSWTNVYYVATNGNDANPGTSTSPWLTLEHARTNLAAGKAVFVRDGTFIISNEFAIPINGALIGSGTNRTRILSYVAPIATNGVAVRLSDNCYFDGIKIDLGLRGRVTNANYPTWAHMYQAAWGVHQSTGSKFTNAVTSSIYALSETDAFYIFHSNACEVANYSCVTTSKWDSCVWQNGPHHVRFYNSDLRSVGPNIISGSTGLSYVVGTATADGSLGQFYDCNFYAAPGGTYVGGGLFPGGGGTFEFHRCRGFTNLDLTLGGGEDVLVRFFGNRPTTITDDPGVADYIYWPEVDVGPRANAVVIRGRTTPATNAPTGSIFFDQGGARYRRTASGWQNY